jgi:hypothetical protein
MKKANFVVVMVAVLINLFASCTSKEEKLYGKIDTKSKDEKALIEKIQNTVFSINENLTLKEAVADNAFSNNIVWKIFPAEKKGAYIVSFEYDIEPIAVAMRTDFYDESYIYYGFHDYSDRVDRKYWEALERNDILSPIGYANMFTRFIASESVTPHYQGAGNDANSILEAYKSYSKDYADFPLFIPRDQMPDQLPVPFFNVKAAKFIGECYSEISSDVVEFVYFSILFDFSLPYLDNKEYKGLGMTSPAQFVHSAYEYLRADAGLDFIYSDKVIFELYPRANNPVFIDD